MKITKFAKWVTISALGLNLAINGMNGVMCDLSSRLCRNKSDSMLEPYLHQPVKDSLGVMDLEGTRKQVFSNGGEWFDLESKSDYRWFIPKEVGDANLRRYKFEKNWEKTYHKVAREDFYPQAFIIGYFD